MTYTYWCSNPLCPHHHRVGLKTHDGRQTRCPICVAPVRLHGVEPRPLPVAAPRPPRVGRLTAGRTPNVG
jgi:hypothetical protein